MNTKLIARTAILLALTVVFQSVGRFIPLGPNSNFVVGPLVNACLIIATVLVGLFGGTVIALFSPFLAILTGAALPLLFAPFVAIGNFLLVLACHIFKKKIVIGIGSGAIFKFAFLYASINFFIRAAGLPSKQAANMLFAFGWPQLITALAGGAIALFTFKAFKKNIFSKENF